MIDIMLGCGSMVAYWGQLHKKLSTNVQYNDQDRHTVTSSNRICIHLCLQQETGWIYGNGWKYKELGQTSTRHVTIR